MKTWTKTGLLVALPLVGFGIILGCAKPPEDETATTPTGGTSSGRYLYATTGICQNGNGVTTFTAATASNQVLKINTTTGNREAILADYWAVGASPGADSPVGVVDWDANNLLVLVLNGTSGRIEFVPKTFTSNNRSLFNLSPSNATVISTAPKQLLKSPDGGLFIVRTTGVEKVSSVGQRVGGAAIVSNNLGATCGTANTMYSDIAVSATGRLLVTSSMAAANNRLISTPAAGATGSCSAAQAAPPGATWPTAVVFDSANSKAIVAYAGNGTADGINSIAVFDYNESTGAFSNGVEIYDANQNPAIYPYLLYSISAMYFDDETSSLYVATANTNAANLTTAGGNYVIEKFTYDASKLASAPTEVLTRVTNNGNSFYTYGVDTKCISSLVVGN